MTRADFTRLLSSLQKIESTLNESKGPAYAGSDDALANFKRIGKKYGVSALLVGAIYLEKHLDSLASYVKGNRTDPEPIEMRIADIRLYSALINAIIVDEKKEQEVVREATDTLLRGAGM